MKDLIDQVAGSMAIEGFILSEEDKERIRRVAADPSCADAILQELIRKHTVAGHDLIDPSTVKPAHRCDYATREWFRMHPGVDTTLAACEKCGLLYKTGLEQLHRCEDLIDPYTGVLLHPGVPDRCPGNGQDPNREICCDNCNWFLECFPEYLKED